MLSAPPRKELPGEKREEAQPGGRTLAIYNRNPYRSKLLRQYPIEGEHQQNEVREKIYEGSRGDDSFKGKEGVRIDPCRTPVTFYTLGLLASFLWSISNPGGSEKTEAKEGEREERRTTGQTSEKGGGEEKKGVKIGVRKRAGLRQRGRPCEIERLQGQPAGSVEEKRKGGGQKGDGSPITETGRPKGFGAAKKHQRGAGTGPALNGGRLRAAGKGEKEESEESTI